MVQRVFYSAKRLTWTLDYP